MKRRTRRGILFALMILALLIGGGWWWASVRLESWVAAQLRIEIAQQSKGHYRLEHISLRLGLWPANVMARNIVLTADTASFPDMTGVRRVSLPACNIMGIGWWKALREGHLHIRSLVAEHPEVHLQLAAPKEALPADSLPRNLKLPPDSAMQALLGTALQQLTVASVEVRGARCVLTPPPGATGVAHKTNARLASTARGFTAPVVIDSLHLRIRSVRIERGVIHDDALYPAGIQDITLTGVSHDLRWNTRKGAMQVSRLAIGPDGLVAEGLRFRPFAYAQSPSVRVARAEAPTRELIGALFRRKLALNTLTVTGLQVLLPPGRRKGNVQPQKPLYALVAPILDSLTVKTLQVAHGKVEKERLTFDDVQATWQGISLHRTAALTLDDLLYGPSLRAEVPAFTFTGKNERYRINTGKVAYNARTEELRIQDVHFAPNRAFADSVSVLHNLRARLYTLTVPEVVLSGATLRKLIRNRYLGASLLRLVRPHLFTDSYRTIDTAQLKQLADFNLYEVLKSALDSVTIAEVAVDSGQVEFRDFGRTKPQNLHARDFTGRIVRFRVNETLASTPDKPFFADDLSVAANVQQYTLMLPDSSHEVTIQHISISTAEKKIFIDSIWIQPTIYAMRTLRRNEAVNAFIPHAEIRGLNVYELYRDRVLRLAGLYVQQPQIDVTVRRDHTLKRKPGEPVRGFGLSELNIYPLFARYFNGVDLGEVLVEKAVYRQHNFLEGKLLRQFEIPDARLHLTGVHIYDAPALTPSHLLYAQGFEATLHGYRLGLADSVHEISFGTIAIRSHAGNERIELQDIAITPTYAGADRFGSPRRYTFRLPTGLISGVDLYQLFEKRSLAAKEVRLVNPDITYRYLYHPANQPKRDTLATDFAGLIRGELNDMRIGQFVVMKGRFDFDSNDAVVVQEFQAEAVTGALWQVRLNHGPNSLRFPFMIEDARVEGTLHNCTLMLPDSSYVAQIGRVVLSEGGKRLDLDSVRTFPFRLPDTRAFSVVDIGVNHLSLTGVDLLKLYTTRDIHLATMQMQRPQVRITRAGKSSGFRARNFNPLQDVDLYSHLSRVLNSIALDTFLLADGTLEVISDDSLSLHLPEVTTLFTDIRIDSQRKPWDNAFLYARNAVLQVRNYSIPWDSYFSDLQFGTVTFETATRQVRIDSMRVAPRFNPDVFYDSIGRQSTYMRVFVQQTTLNNTDILDAVLNGRITVGRMDIQSPVFYLYADQNHPRVESVVRGLPMDFLRKLAVNLRIDTTRLTGGSLVYEELAEGGKETGYLALKNMYVNLFNLTNDPVLRKRNPVLRLEMGSGFMDNGHFVINAYAHLNSTSRRYEYSGEMAAMDLRELNHFLPPTHSLTVESGLLQRATFDIKSKNNESTGEMRMYYKDLKLSFVNKKDTTQASRAMASALANAVIRQDNPSRQHFRIGHVESSRDPYHSIIYDIIHAMLSGIKSSAGLAKKEGKDKEGGLRDMIRTQKKRLKLSRKPEPSLQEDPNHRKHAKRKIMIPDEPAGSGATDAE